MKRSVITVLILLLVFSAGTISAMDLIGLRIGPTAMLITPIGSDSVEIDSLCIEDFSFGIDARLNLTIAEVNVLALFEPKLDTSGSVYGANIEAIFGAGVSLPIAEILQLGFYVGPAVSFAVTNEGVDDAGDFPMDPGEIFASNLFARATADLNFGDISVGGSYIVDTNTNLNGLLDGTFNSDELFANLVSKAGMSVLFELF